MLPLLDSERDNISPFPIILGILDSFFSPGYNETYFFFYTLFVIIVVVVDLFIRNR